MRTYGTLSRVTKHGHTSTWHFIAIGDEYWAIGGCHKPLAKRFVNIDELRSLYSQYISYGYMPLGESAVADTIEQLPVIEQLSFDV